MNSTQSERQLARERDRRSRVREMIAWMKSDLFKEERYEGESEEPLRAFRNPGGYRVILARSGSGWIEGPDGKAVIISSGLDVQTLDEYLP